jgi:hypothetical protein
MLCQCWSYFFHWTNIDKMSNILVLYQCHFKTCCYNVILTSYQWLYQHWTLNILLRCCKSTRTKRGQVCDDVPSLTFHSSFYLFQILFLAFLFSFLLFHSIFDIFFLFFCTFRKQSCIMDERKKQILVEMAMYWCLYINSTTVKPTSLEFFHFTFVIVNNLHDRSLDKNMENI